VFSAAVGWLMDWFDPVLDWNTHDTTVPIHDLQAGDRPMTLYLCFTPADLQGGRLRPLARLLVDQLFALIAERPTRQYRRRVRLIFEDFATLGYFPPAETAAEFYREAGIDLLCLFQSLMQVWRHFGPYTSLLENLDTTVVFPPNNPESAEWVTGRMDEVTVQDRSVGHTRPEFGLFGSRLSRTVTRAETLMRKGELLYLDRDRHLVFVGGGKRRKAVNPILARGRSYRDEPAFQALVRG
jgi:type IV secretion system protein VirD4